MCEEMIIRSIDGVAIRLRDDFDFRFMESLGKVFCVFDEQDSGNLCFGMETDSEKLFVKIAGAKTICYTGRVEDAIDRLTHSISLVQDLQHPALIELRDHFEVSGGYAAVYTWFPGECLHSHWAFTPYEKYHHPDSPLYRYRHLPIELRLKSLDTIFAFHEYVAQKGYVAIDFYDGSILYDFAHHRTMICDIDLYEKRPYINMMGRLWGSSRFMSPEEFELGAEIDEITNVFTMGAVAFVALGGEKDRSPEKWEASEALYQVALQAVHPDRSQRFPSISAFRKAWNHALDLSLV